MTLNLQAVPGSQNHQAIALLAWDTASRGGDVQLSVLPTREWLSHELARLTMASAPIPRALPWQLTQRAAIEGEE